MHQCSKLFKKGEMILRRFCCPFASKGRSISTQVATGLFGIKGLQQPSDFITLLKDTRARCDDLLHQILAAPPDASVVQLMDDMSDELCRTYDAAECCRNLHADMTWRQAATAVCQELGAYLSKINHHRGMYDKLAATMHNYYWHQHHLHLTAPGHHPPPPPDQHSAWGPPAAAHQPIGGLHPSSSSCSNTHRQDSTHDTTTSGNISNITGSSSVGASSSAPPFGSWLTPQQLAGYDPETVHTGRKLLLDMEKAGIHLPAQQGQRMQQLMNLGQHYNVAFNQALTDPKQVGTISIKSRAFGRRQLTLFTPSIMDVLANEPDESIRQQVYTAGYSTPQSNRELLDGMIAARREMAGLVGCSSYSAYKAAEASLAQQPGAITAFLEQLSDMIRPKADAEIMLLRRHKARASYSSSSSEHHLPPLRAWDMEYYSQQAKSAAAGVSHQEVAKYLNLGSVLQGIQALMKQTLSITLDMVPAPVSETWAPGLLKCTASHTELGPLGTIYLDLASRPGKYPSAVTFPIVCGRSLCDGSYQLPVVVLVADFGSGRPDATQLSYGQLKLLMHELGHCIHSLTSRTRYQHVWGTRCAQDLVEVPSHLFEHFVSDHRTLQLLARHQSTREPIPKQLCVQLVSHKQLLAALELQSQVLISLVDQRLFGTEVVGPGGTSRVWQALTEQHTSVPFVPGTSPELCISHFTIYGATYYSYVYARCLSSTIWNKYLAANPLDPSAGYAICKGLLQPGGAVEPLQLLQGLLGPAALQHLHGGWAPKPDDHLLQRAIAVGS